MIKKDSICSIVGNSKYLLVLFLLTIVFNPIAVIAQEQSKEKKFSIDLSTPNTFTIGGLSVRGIKYLEDNVVIMLSGLNVGDKITIPGDDLGMAIKRLWKQGLAENVQIAVTDIQGDEIFLEFILTERPRLNSMVFPKLRRSEMENLRDAAAVKRGDVVTNYLLSKVQNNIEKYYIKKGFLNIEVNVKQEADSTVANSVVLIIDVKKQSKVKIYKINIYGNDKLEAHKVKSYLKETKEKGSFTPLKNLEDLLLDILSTGIRLNFSDMIDSTSIWARNNLKTRIFKASKFIKADYNEDLKNIIYKYNTQGYRDAIIVKDSVYKNENNGINIDITIDEGKKYYFGNITWVGNTKYSSAVLSEIMKIKKGDVYNKERLETNLSYNPTDTDVSSLYMDDGYLFFNANPVEVAVNNDSIDIEVRISEGDQARIARVTLSGNSRTNDHVVMREIRTRPGQLFSRENIIRTTRELSQLKFFNPENINPDVKPNMASGTVDIEYQVEETSSDQIELSGGWGYGRFIGTLGLSFNNFSLRNMFNGSAWRPIPTGDGQKLSLRFQTYGAGYFNYSASFTEPWFGGKKPNSFTVSYFHSLYTNSRPKGDPDRAAFKTDGITIGLGKRLRWPDDYFTIYHGFNFQIYSLDNYTSIFKFGTGNGKYHNFNYTLSIGRNSISAPIYPRSGSDISFSVELTPPYSLLNGKDYSTMDADEKYRWIEYHKWKFNSAFYIELADKLVLGTKARFGYIGGYNSEVGTTPFGRFYLGGDGLSGSYNLDSREIIAMRGYSNESITPDYFKDRNVGASIYAKYTLEIRYPLSLNPSATIYAIAYVEAGNSWADFKHFDPFSVKRSAGLGIRVFMPMFGFLGLDWAYGFDEIPGLPDANGAQFHFSINQSID